MSITRRGPNAFRFVADLPPDPVTNARRQTTKTFRGTAKEAKLAHAAWYTEVKGEADQGSTATTFGTLLLRYLDSIRSSVEQSTYAGREVDVRKYLIPALGNIPLRDLKASHFDSFYRSPAVAHLAPSTISNIHSTARQALKTAVRWEWVNKNAASLAKPPTVHRAEPVSPDHAHLDALLAYLRPTNYPLFLFVELLAATGARPGEMCAVRWMDLDLPRGTVEINGSITRNTRTRKTTKTHKVRSLHLDAESVTLLEKWQVECGNPSPDRYVFSDDATFQVPWCPGMLASRLRVHTTKIGLAGKVTFRSERHYHATNLVAGGVDIVTVARRLGHSNPSMTLDVYSSSVPRNDQDAAELLRLLRKRADGAKGEA